MTPPTLYDRLGVDRDATTAEIHARFRRIAREVHPDLARDAAQAARHEAATKGLTEAWSVLSSPERRAAYDAALGWDPAGGMRRAGRRLGRAVGARRPAMPSVPRPGVRLPSPPPVATLAAPVIDTRLGQWAIVLGSATSGGAAVALLSGDADRHGLLALLVTLAIAGGLSLLLSLGGPPSPLWDGSRLFWGFAAGIGGGLARLAGTAARSAGGLVVERVAEARTTNEEMARLTEADAQRLAGIRPGSLADPYADRYRPPRSSRRGW